MECPICFHEHRVFKLLECEHYFCETCLADLLTGKVKVVNSAGHDLKSDKKSSAQSSTETSAVNENDEIECPQCRTVTKVPENNVEKLKPKFTGDIRCYQCDEDKPVIDFRWCRQCVLSVCSACYLDRHSSLGADGSVQLHESVKWESLEPIKFALSQLKAKKEQMVKANVKIEGDMSTYIDGLVVLLRRQLQQVGQKRIDQIEDQISKVARISSIDLSSIPTANQPRHSYEYVISALAQLIDNKSILDQSINNQSMRPSIRFHAIPYNELSKVLLTADNQMQPRVDQIRPSFDCEKFARNLKQTDLLGSNVLDQPMDICVVNDDYLLIADHVNGLFVFHDCTIQGPLPLKHNYQRYSRVAPVPDSRNWALATVHGANNWSCILLKQNSSGMFVQQVSGASEEKEHSKQVAHWPLPHNDNCMISYSKKLLLSFTGGKRLNRLHFDECGGIKVEWRAVNGLCLNAQCQLGPIIDQQHQSQVLVFNPAWAVVDLHTIAHNDSTSGAVRRVELPWKGEMHRPMAVPLDSDRMLLADRTDTKLMFWNSRTGQSQTLYEFRTKTPQVIVMHKDAVHLVVRHRDDSTLRALETVYM